MADLTDIENTAQDDESPVAFKSIGDFMRMLAAVRYVEKLQRSGKPIPENLPQIPNCTGLNVVQFAVTGSPDKQGWYPASSVNRDARTTSLGSEWYNLGEDFLVQGLNKEPLRNGIRYDGIVCDETRGTESTATYNADDVDVGGNTGLTDGDKVTIYWTDDDGNSHTHTDATINVDEDDETITFTGGAGDAFPDDGTSISYIAQNSGKNRLPCAIVIATGASLIERVQVSGDADVDTGYFNGTLTPWDQTTLAYIAGDSVLLQLAEGEGAIDGRYYRGKLLGWKDDSMLWEIWGNDDHYQTYYVKENPDDPNSSCIKKCDLYRFTAPFAFEEDVDCPSPPPPP